MAIATSRKKSIGSNIDKMKGLQLTDLLVPGLFILVLALLTFFVFIPSIEDTQSMRDEIDEINKKQDILSKNLEKMEPLIENKALLYQDLVTTKKIIPRNLDVADFAYFVDKTARNQGLKFKEIEQGNNLSTNNSKDSFGEYIGSVNGPIVYEGTYKQIVEFLDNLQDESPYIVQVRDLVLSDISNKIEDDNRVTELWRLELDLTGYFMPQETEISIAAIYSDFVPYTKRGDVMEIFNYKARLLNEGEDEAVDDDLKKALDKFIESEQ